MKAVAAKSEKFRVEEDALGEVPVPADHLWGAQTQRSRLNFTVGAERRRWGRPVIRAFGLLKKCAALANLESGKCRRRRPNSSSCGAYYSTTKRQIVTKLNGKEEVYDLSQFRLFGEHNRENLMAAICAARPMGVSQKAIQTVINTFKGVPHRLEFIRKKDGVYFFNDSKGTNVMSVKRSLERLQLKPDHPDRGRQGQEHGLRAARRISVQKKCKILILLGEAKEKINRAIGDFAETYLVGTFEEAVLLAYQKSRSGDIILLSPGCSSYDMFRNYEERGDLLQEARHAALIEL